MKVSEIYKVIAEESKDVVTYVIDDINDIIKFLNDNLNANVNIGMTIHEIDEIVYNIKENAYDFYYIYVDTSKKQLYIYDDAYNIVKDMEVKQIDHVPYDWGIDIHIGYSWIL